MKHLKLFSLSVYFALSFSAALMAQTPKPKHINKAIEMWAQGQPVYFDGPHEGISGSFEQGKKDAQTFLDYISYDMEHAPFDVKGLSEYMKGLAAGGPTKSGHKTPAVIVNVPVNGVDEAVVRANAWMFYQVLATGVHGIMLTHADTPGAVRAFVEACRLPIHKEGVDKGLNEGRRGAHGSSTAAKIWGVTPQEYDQKADVWPLNPNGELSLGLKLEDKYALANAEEIIKVPGIAFAEGGPGDMALSLGVSNSSKELQEAEGKLEKLYLAHKMVFMRGYTPKTVIDAIKAGFLVGRSGAEAAQIGRTYTKRPMPW
jgi:4-hydroxy-2-oxoheptanedioate aldolase